MRTVAWQQLRRVRGRSFEPAARSDPGDSNIARKGFCQSPSGSRQPKPMAFWLQNHRDCVEEATSCGISDAIGASRKPEHIKAAGR
jgi:hypothetical protein